MKALIGFLVLAASVAGLMVMTELAHAFWRGLRAWLRPSSADARGSGPGERA